MIDLNNEFKVEFTSKPPSDEVNRLTDGINEASVEKGVTSSVEPFAFLIRDTQGNLVAGCNGYLLYGAIYTGQLWVSKSLRGRGLGKKLIEKVHEYGRSQGCQIATLRTMSFQNAQSFYEKMGYVTKYEETGYSNGQSLVYLIKTL